MMHFPLIAVMLLFLAAFVCGILGSRLRKTCSAITILATGISFALVLSLIKPVMIDGEIIAYWFGKWAPVNGYAIGIGYEVDQISLFFGLLCSFAVFMSAIYSVKYMERDSGIDRYCTLFLMLGGSVLGLVFTGDLFNMFIMVEIMTIAAVALTAFRTWKEGALEAAFKYMVISNIGSATILIGTVLLYKELHTLNIAQMSALLPGNLNATTILAFALLFVGFGVKAFIFPFHPIAADAHGTAPSSISILISGILTKTGLYGIIRLVFCMFQVMEMSSVQFLLVFMGTLSMFVCVTMALIQHDFKRLLALHSISQIGYALTAIGLATALGFSSGLYHAMNHTLFKGLLFLCAGAVLHETHTTNLDELGGLSKRMPKTTAIFLIAAFSISGLPTFNGFASKWLIYQATYEKAVETGNIGYAFVTIIAVVVSVMTLASFIKVSQSVFFGQLPEKFKDVKEAPLGMRIPMWIMAALCVLTGIFPQYVDKYLLQPATNAAFNATKYIDAMMGSGYAAEHLGSAAVTEVSYSAIGYWNPIVWLILFIVVLAAIAIVALTSSKPAAASESNLCEADGSVDYKHATFFSGEKSQYSQVGGGDLFWGLRHNLRHYFGFIHNAHTGVVNDYARWAIYCCAAVTLYAFIFIL